MSGQNLGGWKIVVNGCCGNFPLSHCSNTLTRLPRVGAYSQALKIAFVISSLYASIYPQQLTDHSGIGGIDLTKHR